MKQFVDFIPLLLFFIIFKIEPREIEFLGQTWLVGGIFSATAMLIASSVVVYGVLFSLYRRLEKRQWLTLLGCILFGGLTLAFQSETFLKLKSPVVNWLFALAFVGSHFIGKQPLIQRMMGHAITLPDKIWVKLNIAWVAFFFISGAANLFVAFTFHAIWVDFKVFGSLIMTLIFFIGQGVFIANYNKKALALENKKTNDGS